jgi:hypothetical protein
MIISVTASVVGSAAAFAWLGHADISMKSRKGRRLQREWISVAVVQWFGHEHQGQNHLDFSIPPDRHHIFCTLSVYAKHCVLDPFVLTVDKESAGDALLASQACSLFLCDAGFEIRA